MKCTLTNKIGNLNQAVSVKAGQKLNFLNIFIKSMECNDEQKNQLTITREREMICKKVEIQCKIMKANRSDRNAKPSKSQLL